MSSESLKQRIERAAALITKGKAVAERHRAEAGVHEAKGRHGKAADSRRKADGQDSLVRKHEMTVRTLTAKMKGQSMREVYASMSKERAQEREEARPRPDSLVIYAECMQHIAEIQAEVETFTKKAEGYARQGDKVKEANLRARADRHASYIPQWMQAAQEECENSGRDLHREYAVAQKAKDRKENRTHAENVRLQRLGVDTDDRTAGGSRVYRSPAETPRGSTSSYEPLITIIRERTPRRLETMARFDTLCQIADMGLFPELKMESESRSSGSVGPDIMLNRIGGLDELAEIRDVIGGANVDMLRAWVFERQGNDQLLRLGYGTERTIARLCLAALDALAVYWKTGDALRARIAGVSVAAQAPV